MVWTPPTVPSPSRLAPSPLRVFIVDDHPVVRVGLRFLVDGAEDLVACGEADTPNEALEAIDRLDPDLVVVDVSLREYDGLDLVRAIRERRPRQAILVLSMHGEEVYARRALQCGAGGYVMKDEAEETLLEAIRAVARGSTFLSPPMRRQLSGQRDAAIAAQQTGIGVLTNRELQILGMLGRGRTPREIAKTLNISLRTIQTHRQRIKDKLQLNSALEVIRFAIAFVERGRGE